MSIEICERCGRPNNVGYCNCLCGRCGRPNDNQFSHCYDCQEKNWERYINSCSPEEVEWYAYVERQCNHTTQDKQQK
jgi:hypothetical protein